MNLWKVVGYLGCESVEGRWLFGLRSCERTLAICVVNLWKVVGYLGCESVEGRWLFAL